MMSRRLWSFLLGSALAAGSVSCGLFETREPNEPPVPVENCRPLTSTVFVTLNVEESYGRVSGTTCYNSMLGEPFQFHPDPQDSLQNPDAYVGWDENVEIAHNSKVALLQPLIRADFIREYATVIRSDDLKTETRFWEYALRVTFPLPMDTTATRYTGLADITFHQGADGQWKIIDWADHRGSVSDSTWGLFRGTQRAPSE